MQWDRNILTDSGGFQMVSLLDLAEITGFQHSMQITSRERRCLPTPCRWINPCSSSRRQYSLPESHWRRHHHGIR